MPKVFVVAMSLAEVSARLDEFIRNQENANLRFEPDRENQDVINTELRGMITVLEKRTTSLEQADIDAAQKPEIEGLQTQATSTIEKAGEI